MELIRAVTLTLAVLRATQRRDLAASVRCIRWQHAGLPIPGDSPEAAAGPQTEPARYQVD
jgi:hypothetical protein